MDRRDDSGAGEMRDYIIILCSVIMIVVAGMMLEKYLLVAKYPQVCAKIGHFEANSHHYACRELM